MKIHPDAKMVEIRILEVPHGWKGLVPPREIVSPENLRCIQLVHEPSGIHYSVVAPELVGDAREAAELRAKAKIKFIHELHGEAWLYE